MISDYWPLFGLRVTTPRLELRYATQDDFAALVELADKGIHAPDHMPFSWPWTQVPQPEKGRATLRYYWSQWAQWSAADWHVMLAVVHEGHVIGVQDCAGQKFLKRREVSSGSWLGRAHQGHGFGTEMRAGMLELAFTGLDARWAVSGSMPDNAPSLAVSRRLGYVDDGFDVVESGGLAGAEDAPRMVQRLRLTREAWREHRTIEAEIHGLDACREMFEEAPPKT
jgi:RimJ/RimL family protein N-acetyltransferase